MPPHPLPSFEIQKYFQSETKFNKVYSRNNSPIIKNGTYVLNLAESKSIGSHWIALYVTVNNIVYFDSFGVEHIPKEIKKIIGNESITTNIYGKQP